MIFHQWQKKLAGKTFVFTGSLEQLTRSQASTIVENFSGRVSNSVSKKTNYLIAGPGAGSKLHKAQKLGVQILTEMEFLTMIEEITN